MKSQENSTRRSGSRKHCRGCGPAACAEPAASAGSAAPVFCDPRRCAFRGLSPTTDQLHPTATRPSPQPRPTIPQVIGVCELNDHRAFLPADAGRGTWPMYSQHRRGCWTKGYNETLSEKIWKKLHMWNCFMLNHGVNSCGPRRCRSSLGKFENSVTIKLIARLENFANSATRTCSRPQTWSFSPPVLEPETKQKKSKPRAACTPPHPTKRKSSTEPSAHITLRSESVDVANI